jgi:cobalt/nickel transport system permease protein
MSQPFEAFSDRLALRDNALTRVDARVKLVIALTALTVAAFSTNLLLPMMLFAASLAALAGMRIPPRLLAWRLAAPLSLPVVIVLLRAFLPDAGGQRAVALGPWQLATVSAGLGEGLLIGARVLGSMAVLVLLGTATPAYKVFAALRWLGVPRSLVELLMMMYRYIFCLLRQMAEIHSAQRVRLGYCGSRRTVRSATTLAGMAVLRAMDQAQRTHDAMVARAYAGQLPVGQAPPLRRAELFVLLAGPALLAGCFLLCQGVGQ